MIDIHSHVLPGIDDGPPDLDAALALVRRAIELGVQVVVATPHVSDRYDNRAGAIAAAAEQLTQALAVERAPVQILTGAEIAITRLPGLAPRELRALAIGAGPYVLMESPLSATAGDFEFMLAGLRAQGYRIVLAHPERCPAFQREPERLSRLVLQGAVTSVTAGALAGRFGRTARRFAISMFETGLVHCVSSDMHDLVRRPPGIMAPLASVARELPGIVELAPWLTRTVPAAILAGDPVELPPALSASRRRPRRIRRVPA